MTDAEIKANARKILVAGSWLRHLTDEQLDQAIDSAWNNQPTAEALANMAEWDLRAMAINNPRRRR
jgi:hypothetical protein